MNLKIEQTVQQLKYAYKLAEELAKNNAEPEAGMQCLFIHLEAVMRVANVVVKRRVNHLYKRLREIHADARKNDSKRAFQQAEYVLYGIILGYGEENVAKPHDLLARLGKVAEKMGAELFRQKQDAKDAAMAEGLAALDSIAKPKA